MTKARDIADFKFEDIVDTGTEGTKVASGTTAQRGSTTGQWRFNSTTGFFEGYDGNSFSTLEPDPIITGISPTTATTANQSIVISGQNFFSGSTVKFIGTDGTEYNSPSVTVNSVSQITATTPSSVLTVANEPYDVRVTSSSNKISTLSDALDAGGSPTWNTASGTIATVNDVATGTHATVSATDPDGQTISYSVQSGSLPTGTSLNTSTGVISGDPDNVSNSTSSTFTLRASDGTNNTDRSFNIIVNPSFDGSTSARAAGSPYQIAQAMGSTPTTGVYYIQNSGYNSGSPFQVLCDWTLNSTYGHIILSGYAIANAGTNSYSYFGTAGTSYTGTRAILNSYYEPSYNILGSWSGDSRSRFIVGMTKQDSTSSLSAAGSPNWFEMSVSPITARDILNNQPGDGAYTGTVSASSSGTTGIYYYTSSHGNSIWQMSNTSSNSVNASLWMEMRVGGTDANHSPVVWGDGTGVYYGSNSPYTTRWMFTGFSPDNIRT